MSALGETTSVKVASGVVRAYANWLSGAFIATGEGTAVMTSRDTAAINRGYPKIHACVARSSSRERFFDRVMSAHTTALTSANLAGTLPVLCASTEWVHISITQRGVPDRRMRVCPRFAPAPREEQK